MRHHRPPSVAETSTRPRICVHCQHEFPVDSLCRDHQPTCPMRPKDTP